MAHDRQTVSVFAPLLTLSVTIEAGREDGPDEIHIHPGGQGFWVARMLRHLGERPLLCAPIGGETGRVIRGLVSHWGIDLSPVEMGVSSPTTIQDRRSGDRTMVAETPTASLDRHQLDDAYGRFLDKALTSRACVITGQPGEILPAETFRRLGHDLASAEVPVVGDLHGAELNAYLEGGPIDVLKVSDEDLAEDGLLDEAGDEPAAFAAIEELMARGARSVVLSRAHRPALAIVEGQAYRARAPQLEPADSKGAGDSMTAGLAAALSRELEPEAALKLACGAGAANVTRHGLGSASDDLLPKLAERVEVEQLTRARE